ncbi:MAG: hypothetical protein JSS38_11030 [Nitrospira sp.]|nr:hypothetical protein [Nitrospira sp.]
MKEQYLDFGKHIRTLLPDGEQNREVTVPNRLTLLFFVNYGRHDNDRMMITLTDTMLRLDHLSAMSVRDVEFLGKMHPEDKPTGITTVFSCYWEDAGLAAEPIMVIDHVQGTHEEISVCDAQTGGTVTNIPLLRRVIADTESNLIRFSNMGFFGPKAVGKPRDGLQLSWKRINAGIAVDWRISLEMHALYRKNYEERMAFLEECERKRIEQERS